MKIVLSLTPVERRIFRIMDNAGYPVDIPDAHRKGTTTDKEIVHIMEGIFIRGVNGWFASPLARRITNLLALEIKICESRPN